MGFDTSVYLTPNDAPSDAPVRRSLGRSEEPSVPVPTSARPWTPPAVSDEEDDVDSRLSKFDDE